MSWPALLEAKKNIKAIEEEVEKLLKQTRAMNKKDLVRYKETLLAEVDESSEKINSQITDLKNNLKSHRKYLEAKAVFLRRHHKML